MEAVDSDDDCLIHGTERPRVTDYRRCDRCGHRYRSRDEYVATVHQLCREMGWDVVDDLPLCSYCSSTW